MGGGAASCAVAADDGDAVAKAAAAKMDGRFIFNRLIQTGSIGGKPDRIVEIDPETMARIEKRGRQSRVSVGWFNFPSGRGIKVLPAERTTISHEAEFLAARIH